ncbi:two-component system phosphate regulon sensor histidine kinase PhoR [Saonia flava]|uniref:histidine kinase n=1 Tax=Saonia flava TaxID=523696 RepID=A0A846QT85_9FLAO|nr:HAMP domain-containing sensor histidine kinase [Saonia flava]NJB69563.1 two-component system phosphate regulon sensor histidine kinase PhoR [Saonia flava]
MNKRLFILLVILMTLSLIGIIFVQGYWITRSVEDREEQFSNTVSEVLSRVTDKIEESERNNYFERYFGLIESAGKPRSSQLSNLVFVNRDDNSNEIRFYQHGILEEDYNIASTFFDNGFGIDTSSVKNYTSKRTTTVFKEDYGLDGRQYKLTPVQQLEKIGELSKMEKAKFDDIFGQMAKTVPVHERASRQEIELLISRELKNRRINIDYEYGVYSKGLPTKLKSKKFKFSENKLYKAPIFKDSEGNTNFSLLLNFPQKKEFLFRSIIGMAILSFMFTVVIIVAYTSAIFQLLKQKKISEIKTDFINNMTHEFKTPIATINLAVEAIKNPKIIGDKEKVNRYLQMIREENKRMHAQVENVLRISRLEKKQLEISKVRVDMHDIINDAIAHIELIVSDRGGYVNTSLNAKRTEVLGNEMHLTNVIVNILDNAVKYSEEAPKIDVFTEVAKNSIVVKIQDQGAGMSKAVLKKVFEKFYREHTGNIHNVKGHGLGLAYVKRIIDDHQGEVYAESEKGKGSTFYVKLPLI